MPERIRNMPKGHTAAAAPVMLPPRQRGTGIARPSERRGARVHGDGEDREERSRRHAVRERREGVPPPGALVGDPIPEGQQQEGKPH